MNISRLVDKLRLDRDLTDEEFKEIITYEGDDSVLLKNADEVRRENYGRDVYIRGLIEFSNHCKNDCYYCGIRAHNNFVKRYRLTKEQILACCKEGYALGYRTFVLQGGEDLFFTDEIVCGIVRSIKEKYPDCAVTLSMGERPYKSYKAFFDAGAGRYLLRHETACDEHYKKLHPEGMSLDNRKECLFNLKEIGYQVGAGFMVGSPYQTEENIVSDLRFLQTLQPDMIGIGPFLSHKDTPFKEFENGSLGLTVRLLAVLRLMFPYVLLPATTALATIHPKGREMGLKAGANVVMPNLSPLDVRKDYSLYDNKAATGEESAQSRDRLEKCIEEAGYRVVTARGDVKRPKIIRGNIQ